jgi:protein-L-isoaspartate(D-aspartate) O-methyltransferase
MQKNVLPWVTLRHRMVKEQLADRGLDDERVLAAMSEVPRHEFVPPELQQEAYSDRALAIGFEQTVSQPYMVALMLELLKVGPSHRVLEVGVGSGYQAALLSLLAAEVYGLELVPQLAQRAIMTLKRAGYDQVQVKAGDGTLGWPEKAPFDRIIIAAAAPEVPPPLVEQLAEGGRLVAPVGSRQTQTCRVGIKRQGRLQLHEGTGCVFVPLLGEHGWGE